MKRICFYAYVIKIFRRSTGKFETEKVLGDAWIDFAYSSAVGGFLTRNVLRKKFVSRWVGNLQNRRGSLKKVPAFIRDFAIPMEQFVEQQYRSFNDFFIRAFRPGLRPFSAETKEFSAFAEGRYFVFDGIGEDLELPVKGARIRLRELVGGGLPPNVKIDEFLGGALYLARLCPVDYHRFHFPDAGVLRAAYRVGGHFDSVNPKALAASPRILFENERQVSVLETANFGRVLYVEVGALMVGKIVQSFAPDGKSGPFEKGQEKGYFLFGASTVIVVTERGRIIPSTDLLEQTRAGVETLVELGDTIGKARN